MSSRFAAVCILRGFLQTIKALRTSTRPRRAQGGAVVAMVSALQPVTYTL